MILSVHMLFGAAVGYKVYSLTNNLALAIIAAFLCHYLLDFFPHVEYMYSVEDSIEGLKGNNWKKSILNSLKVLFDFCIGIFIVFLFSDNYPISYIYALVAIIPDGLTVIYYLFPNKILSVHNYFHGNIVQFLKNKKISNFWRISTQVAAAIVSVVILKT